MIGCALLHDGDDGMDMILLDAEEDGAADEHGAADDNENDDNAAPLLPLTDYEHSRSPTPAAAHYYHPRQFPPTKIPREKFHCFPLPPLLLQDMSLPGCDRVQESNA